MTTEKTKVCGIVGWSLGDESFGVTKEYLHWLTTECEVRVVIITPHPEDIPEVDILLLPGGPDVLPSAIGQIPSFYTGSACPFRMAFFQTKLQHYVEAGVPIFGICLGMQMLNTFFGGTLHQHLPNHPKSRYNSEIVHNITTISMLKDHEEKKIPVNSRHHQQVSVLGENMVVIAYATTEKENKVIESHTTGCFDIEAIAHTTLPIVGVQWHPESFGGSIAVRWFKYILNNRKSLLNALGGKSFPVKKNEDRSKPRDNTRPFLGPVVSA